MHGQCGHRLMLKSSWLTGPQIVCQSCGKRWDVRGKMLADACCWGLDILILAVSPVFFGKALRAFVSYGQLGGVAGIAIFGLVIGPFVMAVHFGVFALGHTVHAWCIRRSGDLRWWIIEEPYHRDA